MASAILSVLGHCAIGPSGVLAQSFSLSNRHAPGVSHCTVVQKMGLRGRT